MRIIQTIYCAAIPIFMLCNMQTAKSAEAGLLHGLGVNSCQDFLGQSFNNKTMEVAYFVWASGYISAINTFIYGDHHVFVDLAKDGFGQNMQMGSIKDTCEDHKDWAYFSSVVHVFASEAARQHINPKYIYDAAIGRHS